MMTGDDSQPTSGGDAAGGPPWTLELLAELHAGVFAEDTAARLRSRARTDPQAVATMRALDATRAELATLPPVRIPDHVAARIDAALQAEAAARAGVTRAAAARRAPAGLTAAPPAAGAEPAAPDLPAVLARPRATVTDFAAKRRRRGLLIGAGLLATAAAVAGIVAVSGLTGGSTTGTPLASVTNAGDQALPPLSLSARTLGTALDGTLGVRDLGPLAAAGRLDACLAANGVDPATLPLGAREVVFDGHPGILVVLPAGRVGRYRLLVVSPGCSLGDPAVLADTTVGR